MEKEDQQGQQELQDQKENKVIQGLQDKMVEMVKIF